MKALLYLAVATLAQFGAAIAAGLAFGMLRLEYVERFVP